MELQRVSQLIAETRNLTESDFAARYPALAVIIEPFDGSLPVNPRDATTRFSVKKVTVEEAPVRASGRVGWFPEHGRLRLGREPGCEILLPHPSISKQHALIERTAAGWTLSDAGSTNGTFLDGRRLEPDERAPLADGDRVVLGEFIMVRPCFAPASLYQLVRAADVSWSPPHVAQREKLERLASTFRSLGLGAELDAGKITVESLDGLTQVILTVDPGAFVIESRRNGLSLARRTVSPHDSKVEETLRTFVLDLIQFQAVGPKKVIS
jgi:hypothetical protein